MKLIKKKNGSPGTAGGSSGRTFQQAPISQQWMAPYQQGASLQQMPMQQMPMQQPLQPAPVSSGKALTNQGPNQSFAPSGKGVNQQPNQQPNTLFTPSGFTTTATQNQQAATTQQAAQSSQDQQDLARFRAREQQQNYDNFA